MKHAFVICAYKESEYLEKCIRSIIRQTRKSYVVISTSTPNDYIYSIAEKYNIKLLVREGESDIKDDWNYACDAIDADWITVAHQDDVYHKDYLKSVYDAIEKDNSGIIAFTDYRPIIDGKKSLDANCIIRYILRLPMKSKLLSRSVFFKKLCLSLGNSICCPSVCYHKSIIKGSIFTSDLKFSIDWDTYLKFAKQEGRFIYIDRPLTYYRIHDKATTASFISNDTRKYDDEYMFSQFWPRWIVRILMSIYRKAYDTYS